MKNKVIIFFVAIIVLISFFAFKNYKNSIQKSDNNIFFEKSQFDKLPEPLDTIPTIMIKNKDGKKESLRMNELNITVEVVGNISRTTMYMNFENKTDRILEGELNFPLGEGQTVTRFAMDVNGKLREAVPIEKQKGQKVFEAIVRKNIDPGLLEKTKGNNFKTRVYPIPAKGNKRIVIAYEQELLTVKSGNLYLLPLQFKQMLDKFSIKLEVFMQKVKPVLEQNELSNFEFKQYKQNYLAKKELTNYIANKQIGFVLPVTKNIYKAFVEKTNKSTDNDYFYINIKVKKQNKIKQLPKKICLLYDVSASLEKKDTLKELKVLDEYFKKIKNLKVQLISFSNDIHTNKKFSVINGNWTKLKNELKNPNYDGATQLGILDLNKYKCDEFILISDGVSNFGKAEVITYKTPVNVISSVQSADFSYLKYIALSSGGQYINLTKTTTKQAIDILSKQSYQFISAEYDNKNISDIYPNKPSTFDKSFSITGQLISKKAKIKINFGIGNKIMETVSVQLDKNNIINESNLIQRIWASKKVEDLDLMYKKNKDEIVKTGKKYSIVTRNTSLIILDRLEDYVQYEIVPPKELQKKYFEIVENKRLKKTKFEISQIDKVAKLYENRIKWWHTKFRKDKIVDVKTNKTLSDSTSEIRMVENIESGEGEEVIIESVYIGGPEDDEEDVMLVVDKKNKSKKKGNRRKSSIKLNAWDPQTPYMTEIKKASKQEVYSVYLKLKKKYKTTPSFFLDVSNYFAKQGKQELALRVLSNIAELELENHELLRILAHRLEQLKYYKLAIYIYNEVLKIRTEEPQSYRDLALCLAADKQHQKAIDILYNSIKKTWDRRFPGIEEILTFEMNKIIASANKKVKTKQIDKRLLKNLPTDVRVVLNWDTDNSDMDLWVTDPYNVICFYSHKLTYTGGHMSNDFTRGYGPEEFIIKNAIKGKYKIKANYYGSSAQRISGPTTIYLELYTNYGKKNEKKEVITMRLSNKKEVVNIGELIFE